MKKCRFFPSTSGITVKNAPGGRFVCQKRFSFHNRVDHVLVTDVFATRENEVPKSLFGYDEMKFFLSWPLLQPCLRTRVCYHQNCIQPRSTFNTLTPFTDITEEVCANAHAFASGGFPFMWLSIGSLTEFTALLCQLVISHDVKYTPMMLTFGLTI